MADVQPIKSASRTVDRPAEPGGFKVVDARSLAGKPPVGRRWVVDNMIPAGVVSSLYGDGGTGKSTLALQLAVAMTAEASWIGRNVARGGVIVLSAEDDLHEASVRLRAICQSVGTNLDALDGLNIVDLAGADAELARPTGKGGSMEETALMAELRQVLADRRPALLIIDTLSDVYGAGENERREVRSFLRMLKGLCDDYSTTILLLGHPSAPAPGLKREYSGSTAWNNSVRSRLLIERDGEHVVLMVAKANRGPTGQAIRLAWRDGIFVRADDAPASVEREESKIDALFVRLLGAFIARRQWLSPKHNSPKTYAPRVLAADAGAKGISEDAFAASMERLKKDGRIIVGRPPGHRYDALMLEVK